MSDSRAPTQVALSETAGPVTRTDFVRFAGAGGDFNPNHHDDVHARASGYRSVFAMGMFTAAVTAGCVSRQVGIAALRDFKVRFLSPVWPGDLLTISADASRANSDGLPMELTVTGQDGQRRMTASASYGPPPVTQSAGILLELANRYPRWKGRQRRPLEDCVGEVVRTVKLPVEAGKIREYAIAMKDDAPVYHDLAVAFAEGFTNIPAPPTFTSTASFHVDPELASFSVVLEMNRPRSVHGEQHWSFFGVPVAGDVLIGVSRLAAVKHKTNSSGQTLRFVEIATEFVDERANLIVQETMLAIEKTD
jgi:3-hydroxybutyryl-CoA dehydratase